MRMPALFVGHGSPMNAIEENPYSNAWKELGAKLPRPKAILCVSAHWYTLGTRTSDAAHPSTIYDMYGFPDELYEIIYNAPGAPDVARRAEELVGNVRIDNDWGLDHGTWSVLRRVYPNADIPVVQFSVDLGASLADCFRIGQALSPLRDEGVLILGSGNVVHNLARVNWSMSGGYPWAEEFDGYVKRNIQSGNFRDVIDYRRAGDSASLAFSATDHYAPLIYVLGAVDAGDRASIFNDSCTMGSLSMTSYLFT